ncbi:glutamate carboxypeptidase 2 [Tothia fuscella]|uniref:Glutamate carboxypeptidase 2 n=1 Tax=Tothia fuscella TaxID=1048955 RepID=A0A9P4U2K0_9PEZI|nr:glutamate carboxypeptidase 2 [Tothia fuscella]
MSKLSYKDSVIALPPSALPCLSLFSLAGEGLQYSKRAASYPPRLTELEAILVNSFDNASIAASSYYYTHGLHVAGTNKSQAQWTADHVYINYPVSHSLSLAYPTGSHFVASLEEAVLEEAPTTGYTDRADFERLLALGVQLEGKIALAKYGGPFRGLKVKDSPEYGLIGTVIFIDPGDDGNITVAKGYAPYPDGPARNPTSVQRGSVQFLSIYPGDPTTPGYPSHPDSPRTDHFDSTPRIPSLPISYQDVIPLLSALDGYGWTGGFNSTYSTGPAPGAVLSLSNVMEDKYTPIWDAIGIINGTHQDEVVIVGNHRDAWIVGGAADPNSGSAILVEAAKAFGALLETGWKPRRTIVFASWDMEEYGLVGSTEFVEEYVPWLTEAAVSYVNIDEGTAGPIPGLSATPELHDLIEETAKKIIWPNLGSADLFPEQTLYDVWANKSGSLGILGSGSDFTAFLHKGIGSMEVGAGGGADDPVYHYHSNFDSYAWMTRFGDSEFQIHKAMGQFLILLVYHLTDDIVIPFNITTWSEELDTYFEKVENTTRASSSARTLDLTELLDAIDVFKSAAEYVAELREHALRSEDEDLIQLVNHKYRDFHRGFISQGGLPGREFFQHVITAPGIDTGYVAVTFPGITEALEANNTTLAQSWVKKTADGILVAAGILKT